LGAPIMDNTLWPESAIQLTPNDFFLDAHRRIYAAMAELIEDGKPIDIVTLSEFLHSRKELEAVGGVAYLSSLTDGTPRRTSIERYVRIVKEKARLREFIRETNAAMIPALDGQSTAEECTSELSNELLGIQADSAHEKTLVDYTRETLNNMAEERANTRDPPGLTLALRDLDGSILGLRKHELMVIGGQVERGMTAYVMQVVSAIVLYDPESACNDNVPAGSRSGRAAYVSDLESAGPLLAACASSLTI